MSMSSKVKKTLLAMTAAAALFVAGPSQAGQPYCPNPYAGYHGGYGHGHRHAAPIRKVVVVKHRQHDRHDRRWDRRDDRHDRRWDRRDHRWDDRGDGRRHR